MERQSTSTIRESSKLSGKLLVIYGYINGDAKICGKKVDAKLRTRVGTELVGGL